MAHGLIAGSRLRGALDNYDGVYHSYRAHPAGALILPPGSPLYNGIML